MIFLVYFFLQTLSKYKTTYTVKVNHYQRSLYYLYYIPFFTGIARIKQILFMINIK